MAKAGDSNQINRDFLDSLLLEQRLIDSDLGDTSVTIFGRTYQTPIFNAAFSHVGNDPETGAAAMARGFYEAGSLNFWGMCPDEEFHAIAATGVDAIRIIKPYADEALIFHQIEDAIQTGAIGVGMDLDHAYGHKGGYDVVMDLPMRPKSLDQLRSYVEAAGDLPFVVKGVLSVADAVAAKEAGAKGIIVSHHHGIFDFAVPPLMVLPDIVQAVGGDLTIIVDCGMETGIDAFKALALGADAVCVSRHIIGILKQSGAAGVAARIREMTQELSTIMGRTGFHDIASIDESVIWSK